MNNLTFGFNDNFEATPGGEYLKGGEIHKDIKLSKVEVSQIENKTNPDMKYTVLDIEFSNEAGAIYKERIFEPNAQSMSRQKNSRGNDMPSSWEVSSFVIGHILSTFAPNNLEKLRKQAPKNFAEYAKLVCDALKSSIGKVSTNLKLIVNKDKWARLPYCVNVNKAGEAYLSASFLGEDLSFSSYEIDNIKTIMEATPTSAPRTSQTNSGRGSEDIDFELDIDDEDLD